MRRTAPPLRCGTAPRAGWGRGAWIPAGAGGGAPSGNLGSAELRARAPVACGAWTSSESGGCGPGAGGGVVPGGAGAALPGRGQNRKRTRPRSLPGGHHVTGTGGDRRCGRDGCLRVHPWCTRPARRSLCAPPCLPAPLLRPLPPFDSFDPTQICKNHSQR